MIIRDRRFRPYIISIAIVVLNLVFFLIGQTDSDYSLFGTNLGSGLIQEMSLQTNDLFRSGGLTLVTSFFVHQNASHFLINILFFTLVGFALEKYFSKVEYLTIIIIAHILPLMGVSLFLKEDHLYLGNSLVCYALFSIYSMISERYYLFAIALTIFSVSLFTSPIDWYSMSMHIVGMVFGIVYFLINNRLLGRRYKANKTFHIN